MLLILSGGAIWNEPPGKPVDPDPVGPQPEPDPDLTPYFRYGSRLQTTGTAQFDIANDLYNGLPIRTAWGWRGCVGSVPTKTYTWGGLDAKAANAASRGIKLLGVLSQGPAWASSNGGGNYYPDLYPEYFYDFCGKAAARFKGVVDAFEIYNEPNLRSWTGAQVTQIFIGAATAIRAANPNAIICGGCPSVPFYTSRNAASIQPSAWAAFFENTQVRSLMDVASYHQYQRPFTIDDHDHPLGNLDTIIQNNQNFCSLHGWNGDCWITEGGYPTSTYGLSGEVTEAEQARGLVKYCIVVAMFQKLTRFYQFQLLGYNTPGPPPIEEGGQGITRPDGTKKPAFGALKSLFTLFDADLLKAQRITFPGNANCWVVKYWRKNQRQGYAYWTSRGTQDILFDNAPSQVRKMSFQGVRSIVNTSDNKITLTAGVDPQYVEYWW